MGRKATKPLPSRLVLRSLDSPERVNMIDDIEPLFTLSYRGFVQAWIYRGDQLKHKKREILLQHESIAERRRSRQQPK